MSVYALPRPRKPIRDRALRKHMRRTIPNCERCGRQAHGGPHHIRLQCEGGDDIPENLIRLCRNCHTFGVHAGKIERRELIEIVARREGLTPEEVAVRIGIPLRELAPDAT